MGLTVHYSLKSTTKSDQRARQLVEQMRELALDLPFEEVSDIIDLSGEDCRSEKYRGPAADTALGWFMCQSGTSVRLPWNKKQRASVSVDPLRVIGLAIWPGHGCESCNIGLCRYPQEIEVTYQPMYDDQFIEVRHPHPSTTEWRFSDRKWRRWLEKQGERPWHSPSELRFQQRRKIPTRLGGWQWSSFCKTEYASDPNCGGLANFLRCHISVCTLLDRVNELPTIKMHVEDEGHYLGDTYSDDYQEAYAAGRKPTYVWHDATYSVAELTKQIGESNQRLAAFAGAMKAALEGTPYSLHAPITDFPNFEQLEFKGCQDPRIAPFLQAAAQLAKQAEATA